MNLLIIKECWCGDTTGLMFLVSIESSAREEKIKVARQAGSVPWVDSSWIRVL